MFRISGPGILRSKRRLEEIYQQKCQPEVGLPLRRTSCAAWKRVKVRWYQGYFWISDSTALWSTSSSMIESLSQRLFQDCLQKTKLKRFFTLGHWWWLPNAIWLNSAIRSCHVDFSLRWCIRLGLKTENYQLEVFVCLSTLSHYEPWAQMCTAGQASPSLSFREPRWSESKTSHTLACKTLPDSRIPTVQLYRCFEPKPADTFPTCSCHHCPGR